MGSITKNGKEHTNYIKVLKLLSLFSLLFSLSAGQLIGSSDKTWVVVIDAGHGGKDPGALGSKSREKDINLSIALKTGSYLEKNIKNIKVLYTRKTDLFVGLKERAEFANKNKADLFISIHANAMPANRNIKGAETFIMGPSKDDQNLEVAMKENEAIVYEDDYTTKYEGFDPKSPESYIIFSLMQNVFREQSTEFASQVQSQFKNRAGRIDRGVKQDAFWVLYMTSMPSVLIETGFLTNPDEEKYLASEEGQDYLASAIYRATRDYISELERKSQVSNFASVPGKVTEDTLVTEEKKAEVKPVFMVQIKISREKLETKPENFNGIADVKAIQAEDHYKYATGSFSSFSEAAEHSRVIRKLYRDAFVIAVKDNKVLPLQEAIEMK
ncbi:MAG: N-acetylmuramoyl-L-alanine amidase [Bacteroidales bacterium]|jgi:N-acetylmuramoyl-L-alanine amidase|nr:N-acetylmuramoyl-L-alanine amidase [Bacteroidales bacterium]